MSRKKKEIVENKDKILDDKNYDDIRKQSSISNFLKIIRSNHKVKTDNDILESFYVIDDNLRTKTNINNIHKFSGLEALANYLDKNGLDASSETISIYLTTRYALAISKNGKGRNDAMGVLSSRNSQVQIDKTEANLSIAKKVMSNLK